MPAANLADERVWCAAAALGVAGSQRWAVCPSRATRAARAGRPTRSLVTEDRPMDLATLFGILVAWGAVLYSMFHCTHGEMGSYFKPAEIFLVFGGSIGAAMLSMPLHTITNAISFLKKFLFNKEAHVEHVIKELVNYAETARRDGVLALESVAREAPD